MPPFRSALFALACLGVAAGASHAQEWPAKPVRIVVPFAPGGSSDQLARLLAPEFSTTFGQQFYVENRAGSSGSIGSAQVAKSAPDGYTLVNAGSGPHLTGPAINPNVGYDPLKDFTHIAMLAADSYVLVANPALGVKSIADLVQLGRGRNLTSSSPGAGSLGHLILERFKRSAKLNIQHVPAPNSGMQDLLGNHIDLTFTTLLTAGLQIRGGLLVPLAVTSTARHPAYPDIPTFAEQKLSGCARRHLVLARRTERPSAVRGDAAQPGNPPDHEDGEDAGAVQQAVIADAGPRSRRRDQVRRRRIRLLGTGRERDRAARAMNERSAMIVTRRTMLAGFGATAFCSSALTPIGTAHGANLSQPDHPHHRAVPGRRADRHCLARDRAEDERGLGPAGRGREPAGRRYRDRRDAGRESGARRLHAARRHGHDHGDEPGDQDQPALRPVQGFHLGHARGQEHLAADGTRGGRTKDHPRADRARQGVGQDELRRRHHHHAARRLHVQPRRRHRGAAHPLQGQRRGGAGPARPAPSTTSSTAPPRACR